MPHSKKNRNKVLTISSFRNGTYSLRKAPGCSSNTFIRKRVEAVICVFVELFLDVSKESYE